MNELIVVDVGNSRIKWGRCIQDRVQEVASLPAEDRPAWEAQARDWSLSPLAEWVISGVHPGRRDVLVAWVTSLFSPSVHVLDSFRQLPIAVEVDAPDKVGMDRLLNGVAANRRRSAGHAAVLVDAGTAVTVDCVDQVGAFRGGAIFPGVRLMTRALHDHTALLPVVDMTDAVAAPGTATVTAIQTGVYHAVVGGIERLIEEYRRRFAGPLEVYLTGGDARLLAGGMRTPAQHWPEMTLEGILYSKPI